MFGQTPARLQVSMKKAIRASVNQIDGLLPPRMPGHSEDGRQLQISIARQPARLSSLPLSRFP
jgi:hypothetical protein